MSSSAEVDAADVAAVGSAADDSSSDLPTSVLLVTANVGSVFEDPSRLLEPWVEEFLARVTQLKPQFLALHLQEVGGKTYEKSMEYVQDFIRSLCEAKQLSDYSCIRIYMDEDFKSAEHFTALGNLYFVHRSLNGVKIWNFLSHEWDSAEGKNIYTGNIETISTKEKSKFPQHFFPECKWSRKGFMRTRWEINGTVIDLVNIHLFHDASNLAACEEFPSVYCKTRRRALVHTLERFHIDAKNGLAPFFVFGDFNFRCDTEGVVKELTENLTAHRVQSIKHDSTKVHYRNTDGDNVLTVGKKEFNYADHQLKFKEAWLQKYDRELEPLNEILVEYPIKFPPTYPYEEDPDMPSDYMSTRCPSWCDRILMSPAAKDLIVEDPNNSDDVNPYNILGENVCMGDHKPIILSIQLKAKQGTFRCCNCFKHASAPNSILSKDELDKISQSLNANEDNAMQNYCPYNSNVFNTILIECQKLCPKPSVISINNSRHSRNANNSSLTEQESAATTATTGGDTAAVVATAAASIAKPEDSSSSSTSPFKQPQISINLIDSDNLPICLCSQISEASERPSRRRRTTPLRSTESDDDDDDHDGDSHDDDKNDDDDDEQTALNNKKKICPECQNIIRRQPVEHRCTLISKRLLLANNIIVNRIDTHYLNTYLDNRQDPYTPESAESHSPYPEFETSHSSRSSPNDELTDEPLRSNNNTESKLLSPKAKKAGAMTTATTATAAGVAAAAGGGVNLKQPVELRGIVSPGQLKSRLEHLQRTSLQNEDSDELNEE
ncbi:inositol polyphosphate-5-phosphatase A isoform X2 [Episyrphus balteatus]|uniref:inositol polyphosphate-5-phosphatase A isoform X2 n=1 Tax=Episyrphus balteatus TaxID=286459 RepID=UPI0024860D63|nr:inositol polyphosphate-5-phosphatase A isoform X2 [Episyrphus balteatus]